MRTFEMMMGRRLAALLMAVLLLCASLPAISEEATTVYGCVTAEQVRLRQYASKTAGYWEMLPQGWVMAILDKTTVNGTEWYHVQGNLPSAPDRTYTGYILGECFRPLTQDETTAWLYNPTQGTIPGKPMDDTPKATSEPVIMTAGAAC